MNNFQVAYRGTYCVVCFLVLICSWSVQAGDIFVVGSADGTARTGLPQVGQSFLLNEINHTGILFAVSAYFVAQTNVSFQIWRPLDSDSSTAPGQKRFKLIWQLTVTSSVAGYREDVYMEAKFLSSCALVRPGDWLGVVHLTSPAAIGAQFVPLDPTLMPKIDDAIGGNGQAIGLNATFDMTFTYPYILLMAGYIFSDPLLVNASGQQQTETTTCPTDLLVPSWIDATATTTVAMVTYPSGATGATGATGQLGSYGATGVIGIRGPAGEIGLMGQTGSSGMQGVMGPIGPPGPSGQQGLKGLVGASGLSGPLGSLGDTGVPGPPGPPGNDTYRYAFPPDPQPVLSDDLLSDGGLADRTDIRMGAIIWLAILSAIVVFSAITLVFVCYFVADDRRVQKNEAAWIEPEK